MKFFKNINEFDLSDSVINISQKLLGDNLSCVRDVNKFYKSFHVYIRTIRGLKKSSKIQKCVKKKNLVEIFLKIFLLHGKQIKFMVILNKSISYMYIYFYLFQKKKIKTEEKNFFSDIDCDDIYYYYKFTNLLNIYYDLLEQMFILKINRISKKKRKKTKKKFVSNFRYLKINKRFNYVCKNLIYFNTRFSEYELSVRLGQSLLRTILEFKKSFLYEKKIAIYRGILETSRNLKVF